LYYINRVQLEGTGGTITVAIPPESPLFPSFPGVLSSPGPGAVLPPRDIHRVDATFRNPYSVQASIGAERTFFGTRLSADYVYLSGHDLMSLIDVNAPASIVKPLQRTVADADETRPIEGLPNTYRKLLTLGNLGRSWYRALQVKADRSTGRLQAVASYTLARAEDMGNYQLPEDSRNLAAEKARASTDVRHNFTMGLTWELPARVRVLEGMSLSAIGTFRSNRPYDITWGDDRNGTTQNDARPDGRNTGRTDAFRTVDLAVARKFRSGPKSLEARVEAFNVFNTTNYDQYVGQLLSPLFAKPVSAFPTRRLQVAAVLRF